MTDPLHLAAFVQNSAVQTALWIGALAALLNGTIGVFTVLRQHSFAGHALGDSSSAGGAVAIFVGISALWGFLVMAWMAALAIAGLGLRRAQERDLATGVVLGATLGISALFLYLDVTTTQASGATVDVMFGSIFALAPQLRWPILLLVGTAVGIVLAFYRPLLLISADTDLARAAGLPVRRLELLYLLLLGGAAALSALSIGVILATTLLLGPAAAGLRLARKPWQSFLYAQGIALFAVFGGIYLAFASYYWSGGASWPVSFFVVVLILLCYLASAPFARQRPRHD
ncbi:metal ABC transporter permease [Candidatus Igneacidithiobacillus taiwanensis]|uniref:metal ABC transporter permease n=1 Tax=Candidatus Igneacidithiobacillus taiwanensis TaxID=1945924 RepID=UPI00289E4294|nr:metal ABC transporter permease [Candidatus Igneacidithiobacillus taiwanensis]MCE5361117.1 metal ABC transporter permease [Acidithiobacillus sp.]